MTGDDLNVVVWNALKSEVLIPRVPDLIEALAGRDERALREFVLPTSAGATEPGGSYLGAQLSMDCGDAAPLGARDGRLIRRPGRWATFLLFASGGYCATWGVEPSSPDFRRPVRERTPALLIAGRFDPISPPRILRRTGRGLTRSQFLTVPEGGHVPSDENRCAARGVAAFFTSPASPVRPCP